MKIVLVSGAGINDIDATGLHTLAGLIERFNVQGHTIASCGPKKQVIDAMERDRGTKLSGDRRVEMYNLIQLIKDKKLKAIAAEFRKMKRLWEPKKDKDGNITDKGSRGLTIRRKAEAVMIENATWVMNPSQYIFA